MAAWIKMSLGTEVGLCADVIVLDRNPAPLPKRGQSPQIFGPFLLSPIGWVYQDATWYGCRPQLSGLCVSWRTSPPSPIRDRAPEFLAHVYCGQTAGWIKMSLGMEVGLGLRDILFDVDPATPRKKGTPTHPIFGPCLLWPNGWMD